MTSARTKEFKPLVALSNQDDVLIDFNQKIGEWAYGFLYKGYSKNQNKKVMVKVVDLKKFPLPKSCLDTEVTLLKKLQNNKYVVKFAEYRFYENTLTLTTDICNKGSLRTYLQKRGSLPEIEALHLLLQIIHGLKGLHDLEYSHGALRPENILLHEENGALIPKLTTFVFAKPYSSGTINRAQLPYDSMYLSPEVLKTSSYNSKSDLWALGVIYYEMLYGRIPWTGKDMKQLESNIISNNLEFPLDNSISETSTSFLSKCLDRNYKKRMDWSEIMQHRLIFRGMFSKGNGTYKTLNDEFKEETPLSRKLMYGLRRETPNCSFIRPDAKQLAKHNISVTKGQYEITDPDTETLDTRMITLSEEYGMQTQGTREAESMIINVANTSLTSSKATRINSGKVTTARHQPAKSHDERFYSRLMASVATTDDFFKLKSMRTQKSISKNTPSAHKAYTSPFRQLSFKAEMLGELCQLIQENKEYPLYDKILKVLEEEAQKLNNSVGIITNISQTFNRKLETSMNQSMVSNKGSFTVRTPKGPQSIPKKEKSKVIHELLKEILATLTSQAKTNPLVNSESIIIIAANLKVLREFEEIGEDVSKQLESLKDILQMFHRKKHYDHLKYLLLVKNLV